MRRFHPDLSVARLGLMLVAPALILALAACSPPDSGNEPGTTAGGGDGGSGETHIVHLADFAFEPVELSIAAGDSVRFVNDDDAPHTATHGEDGQAANDAAFDLDLAAAGEEGAEAETEPLDAGEYSVTCTLHPEMNMTLTVAEE